MAAFLAPVALLQPRCCAAVRSRVASRCAPAPLPRGATLPLAAVPLRRAAPARRAPARSSPARACAATPTSPATPSAAATTAQEFDPVALVRYFAATALQLGLIVLTMAALDAYALPLLPAGTPRNVAVGAWFAFNSLRSRTFSPLDNRRPTLASERDAISTRRRPSWMPPPIVFPIVWTSMAVLRTASSVLIFEAVGSTLLAPPLILFMLHLCVGDTWNTVNNVEKRLGVAVPGVLLVWASACAATAGYYHKLPLAGVVLAPLCAWLCIASALVADIWRLNNTDGQYPLYPTKAMAA